MQERTKLSITPATLEDVTPHFQGLPPYRLRAYVGRINGTDLGFGGLYFLPDGTRVGFLILTEEGRRYPKAVLKATYEFLDKLKTEGVPSIKAVADPAIPAADRFLRHLGFTSSEINGQKIYTWQTR